MKETELKPCPFCGGKAEITNHHNAVIFVQCADCYATFPHFDTEEEASEAWNRRVYDDHLLANGVIVPPVKVGQMVYVLFPKEQHWNADDRKWIITRWAIHEFNIVSVHYSENKQGKKTFKYRCSNIDRPSVCKDYSVDEIGRTVFLTREEAEKALAKGGE